MSTSRPDESEYPDIRSAVGEICARFGDPYWRDLDRTSSYPTEFVDALTKAGWLAALIPEELGGSGLGIAEASVILEEIQRQGGNAAACHAQRYVMGTLLKHASAEQKQRYLPWTPAWRRPRRAPGAPGTSRGCTGLK